jgi:AraC family transcriptional regulator, L-rhamnose operon transcriptional activator RhaR
MERDQPIVYPREVVFRAGRLAVGTEDYLLNGTYAAHAHDFYEIALIINGMCRHQAMYGTSILHKGTAIVVRPGEWHAYTNCRDLAVRNCYVGTELFGRELAWMLSDPVLQFLFGAVRPQHQDIAGPLFVKLRPRHALACSGHLESLKGASSGTGGGQDCFVMGQLHLLFANLAAAAATQYSVSARRRSHPAVEKAAQLFRNRLAEAWTLRQLSRELHGINPSYLVRLFHDATGLAPMQFLARLRAERAASLLVRGDEAVGIIGGEVGWNDPNYFSRRFRSFFGMSPVAYREKYRLRHKSARR